MIQKLRYYIRSLEKEAIPQLSINCVIFGFHGKKLHVVVNRIALEASRIVVLPGGFIGQNEDVSKAVERIVKESTGLERILFQQFAVFGDASRTFGTEFKSLVSNLRAAERAELAWISRRFVTICYMALVDFNKISLQPTQYLESAEWMSIDKSRTLNLDHKDILDSARATLLKELPYSPIASNLLPPKFTLPELHALTEAILGRPIDRPNFRRKILKSDQVVKVGQDASGKRRPADLYAF
ncbi:MAG TPA: NUDIX domain-containing protein, partial [Chryseolinea sp.]|nr:NUDIX domain-containing protein [Chryseolinea sp.]